MLRKPLLQLSCVLAFAIAMVISRSTGAAELAGGVPIVAGMSYVVHSQILGDDREVNVWLPSGYGHSNVRYSVVYVLDGARDQDFAHIAGLGQLGELSGTYETLIIVGVQTRKRIWELTPKAADPRYLKAFPENGGAPLFRRFLGEEVVPFVEAHFRTGPKRALMGESLAGLFVVDTFLKCPRAFNDYISISPSLWWDDRALTQKRIILPASTELAGRRLYLTMGDEGGTSRKGMDELVAALQARPQRELTWTFVDRSASETHATIYHVSALDALRTFYRLPSYSSAPAPWWNIEGGSPP